MEKIGEDADLTNLSWVAGTPVPINLSVSPPNAQSKTNPGSACTTPQFALPLPPSALTKQSLVSPVAKKLEPAPVKRPLCPTNGRSPATGHSVLPPRTDNATNHNKPQCSYTCLIALALKSSASGSLPVNEIYKYIEGRFPYFRHAPDGWKNSVRHNLSLNQAFRKVQRSDGWQGKKGYLWEVNPERESSLEQEVAKFLRIEGRTLADYQDTTIRKSILKDLHVSIPQMPCYSPNCPSSSPHSQASTRRVVYTSPEESKYEAEPPFTPRYTPSDPTFDTSNPPSQYVGVGAPASDPQEVARDLFGLELSTSQESSLFSDGTGLQYSPFFSSSLVSPAIIPPGLLGNSPGAFMSPPSPLVPSGCEHVGSQYTTNISPLQALYSPQAGCNPYGSEPCGFIVPGEILYTPPSLVPVYPPGYKGQGRDLINMLDDDGNFEQEDPLAPPKRCKGKNGGVKRGRGKGRGKGRQRGGGSRSNVRRKQKKMATANKPDCPDDTNTCDQPWPSEGVYTDCDRISGKQTSKLDIDIVEEEGLSFEELMAEPQNLESSVSKHITLGSGMKVKRNCRDEGRTPSLKDLIGIVDDHMSLDILSEIEVSMDPVELQSLQEVDIASDPALLSFA